ncbi:MAG: helix-turn-helix domain-containing protein [Paludibacter sp.]
MQNRICLKLNRPFTLFLSYRKGRIYFIWMIFIEMVLANVLQPFGLINNHEFHKPLLVSVYILVFFGTYAGLYLILSYFFPQYYKRETWTVKKELLVLLLFIPLVVCTTYLYAFFFVSGFKPGLSSFIEYQFYNSVMSGISIPVFALFVNNRLHTRKMAARRNQKESHLTLSKKQCREILQKLRRLLETQKPYLSNKFSIHKLADTSGIPLHHISYAINHFNGCNFNDFINQYRVDEVRRILQTGPDRKFKLEAIGEECGFGSKVSYYAAFKKFTGKTPGDYLDDLKPRKKWSGPRLNKKLSELRLNRLSRLIRKLSELRLGRLIRKLSELRLIRKLSELRLIRLIRNKNKGNIS